MQEIKFYCRKCKGSMRATYNVTGDKDTPVLNNIVLSCPRCRKASVAKKYTEGMIVAGADKEGKYYL